MAISALAGHHIVMCVDVVVVKVRSNGLCGFRQTIVDDGFGEHQDIARLPSDCGSTGHFQTFVVPPSQVEVAFVRAGQRDEASVLRAIICEKEHDVEHAASDKTVAVRIVCRRNTTMPATLFRTAKFGDGPSVDELRFPHEFI